MKLHGGKELRLPRDEAWRRLTDLQLLAEALPEAEILDSEGEDALEVRLRPATGLGTTPMRVRLEVVERAAADRFAVRGVGGAAEYGVRFLASFSLSGEGEVTAVAWELELHLHGVLRSLTQRVIEDLAAEQVAAVLVAIESAPAAPA